MTRPLRALLVTLLLVAAVGVVGTPRAARAAECQTFAQTGKSVCGLFLDYWRSHGGLAQQGLPLTSEFDEVNATNGKTYKTQYFERARFEYHPENADPQYQVLLGLVGREQFLPKYPNGVGKTLPDAGPNRRCFPQTGFCVNDRFIAYWDTHGGLSQQGLPISPLFTEKNPTNGLEYATQYFERARFEYHPENADSQYQVLLGLLGREQLLNRYAGLQPATLAQVYSTTFTAPFPGTAKQSGTAAATYQPSGPGRLRIAGDGSLELFSTAIPGGQALPDLRIEAGVIQSGAGDSSFGLICRSRADGGALKVLVGGGRIVFGVTFPTGGVLKGNILLDQELPNGLLAPVGQINQVRFDCVGRTMSLTLNGTRIAELTIIDPVGPNPLDPVNGGFGLSAFPSAGSAVSFDSLTVQSVTAQP